MIVFIKASSGKFVLHTPDFEAAKCWAGNLAKTATHASVYAQLVTEDGHLTESQIVSEPGQSFAASLVLSDDAKRFAIAREIERTKMQPFIFHGTITTCTILLNYNLARIINKRLELFSRPPMFRMYLSLGLPPTMILR